MTNKKFQVQRIKIKKKKQINVNISHESNRTQFYSIYPLTSIELLANLFSRKENNQNPTRNPVQRVL